MEDEAKGDVKYQQSMLRGATAVIYSQLALADVRHGSHPNDSKSLEHIGCRKSHTW